MAVLRPHDTLVVEVVAHHVSGLNLRDRLAHRYFDTTHSQVAGVVKHDLEPLKAAGIRLQGLVTSLE